jgi:hypothetical protein
MGMTLPWRCTKCGVVAQSDSIPPIAGCPGQQGTASGSATGNSAGSGTGTGNTQNHDWQQTAG